MRFINNWIVIPCKKDCSDFRLFPHFKKYKKKIKGGRGKGEEGGRKKKKKKKKKEGTE